MLSQLWDGAQMRKGLVLSSLGSARIKLCDTVSGRGLIAVDVTERSAYARSH